MSISSKNSTCFSKTTVPKYTNCVNSVSLKPIQQHIVEKKVPSTTRTVIGIGLAATIAIGCDLLFFKAKHLKSLTNKLKKMTKNEHSSKVKAEIKPELNKQIKSELSTTVKKELQTDIKQDVKPVSVEIKTQQLLESKPISQAETELENFSESLANMSRADLAKEKYELDRWGGKIDKLERKAKEEGLTELEKHQLDTLNKKLELIKDREKQISDLLKGYIPDVSDTSAVSMHHQINGYNGRIRDAVEARANHLEGLDAGEIEEVIKAEKLMSQIDKEFEQLPPLEKDCIVYRGRAENPVLKSNNKDFKIMENTKVGDIVVPDKAYSYTAFHYDMANNWCQSARMTDMDGNSLRTIMYEIHLPKGAKVSRNLEHRGEVVMPRGAEYIVKDKKVDSEGCMEFILEYILPKTN